MKDELGDLLKRFEIFSGQQVPPDTYIAVRLDGRGFSGLTERKHYEHPFDIKFRDAMVTTATSLVEAFNPVMAYTQSDEISVLFGKNENIFERRAEKLVSTTASFAGSRFTQAASILDEVIMFDARIIALPNIERVADYICWRHADAARNALNSWAYWTLRKNGSSANGAAKELLGKGAAYKNELLFGHGINFNDVPLWQRRGIMLTWEYYAKNGYNPVKKETVTAKRRRVKVDMELPMGKEFAEYARKLLT